MTIPGQYPDYDPPESSRIEPALDPSEPEQRCADCGRPLDSLRRERGDELCGSCEVAAELADRRDGGGEDGDDGEQPALL